MEELRLWIKDVGFPIAVACIAIYALYKMFMIRETEKREFSQAMSMHAQRMAEVADKSAVAVSANTEATLQLTKEIREKFGSDEVRKQRDELVRQLAEKFGCNAEMLLRHNQKDKQK